MANQSSVFLWIGLVTSGLLLSCQPKAEEFVIGLEPEFEIELQEALGPSPRSLELVIRSISPAPCIGSSLLYTWKTDDEKGSLNVTGYTLPEVCVQPATAISTVGHTLWTNEGIYALHCSLRGIGTNPGTILCTQSFFSLEIPHNAGFISKQPMTYRLPDKCFWGSIATTDESQCHSILTFLEDYQKIFQAIDKGNYGHFEITDQNNTTLDATLITPHRKGSDFAFLGEPDAAFLSNLRSLIDNSSGKMEGKLWTHEGSLSF